MVTTINGGWLAFQQRDNVQLNVSFVNLQQGTRLREFNLARCTCW